MKDVSLYGHLTIDTIIDGVSEIKTLGSIANVWKALVHLDSSIKLGLSPIDIGEALIYIDHDSSRRYSKAALNLKKISPRLVPSHITHLCYLNEISDTTFISTLSGIVTADVCPGKSLDRDLLRFVDYLFISDEDVDDFDSLVDSTKGWVILHSSSGSVFSDGIEEYTYELPKDKILSNVNVLGAGDMFAACFLYKLLLNIGIITDWVEYSHLRTTEFIQSYK
tara:strand:- start:10531 stop:11199 length:669 start_codon:yes stop_codon:yes gene_type:complete